MISFAYFMTRKVIHVFSGILFIAIALHINHSIIFLGAFSFTVLFLDLNRLYRENWNRLFLRVFAPFLKAREERKILTGATTLWISLYVLYLGFPETTFLISASIVVLADPGGAIAGRTVGVKNIYHSKTLGGSTVFFLLCIFLLWQYWNIPLIQAFFMSIILTAAELFAVDWMENFILALSSAVLLTIFNL